jgi:predicted RNA binding protein YcfA (HicA-like mRNA interferase family)
VKLPRDLSGTDLVRLLKRYGYAQDRQTGSHVRLTARSPAGEHHITIPAHDPLRVGTLAGILSEVGGFLGMTQDQLRRELFG